MVHALLGEHQNVVDLLLERLEALRDPDCDLPRVVILSGPAGSGKTRIVQELYARLRSEQADTYWPAIGDAGRTRGGAGTDPMAGRKVVAPRIDDFVWPAGMLPTFGWWGLNCERLSSGSSQDVVSAMRSQLEAHALPLVMARRQVEGWKDKTRRLAGEAVDEVRSAFVDEGLGAAFDVLKKHGINIPCGSTLVKWGFKGVGASWRRIQELNRLKRDFLLGEQGRSMQRTASQQLADMLISLSCRDLPAVVAIEDMHLMGHELPVFLGAVSSRRTSPVLVVGTVWPEGEGNAVYRRWMNKAQRCGTVQHLKSPTLEVDDLSRMIQEEAPRTSQVDLFQIAECLNNPYLIRLWLTENRTREHIEGHGGAVVLADENIRLPEDVMAVLKARWDELDDAVRNGVLYAAAISPDTDGSACRFVSEVVAGVVNRREPDAHYDVRMGLRRAIEKLCWCRSEQGVDFFVEPLLVEYLRRKADSHFGKEGWRQLCMLTQDALAEWICRHVDGIDLPSTEVSMFACRWFLDLDEGGQSEELKLARAAAQWCLAQNADSYDEVGDALEYGKKTLAALLVGNPLSEKAMLNVRAAVADYALRGGEAKDALNRYSALLPAFEKAFGIHHQRTMSVRHGRACAMAGVGKLEECVAELNSLLEDQSAVLGGGHPDSWATRSRLVELLNRLGRVEETLALCNDGDGVPGGDSVAHNLLPAGLLRAAALMGDKRASAAVEVCRVLLGGVEQEFGPDHENSLEARSNLAAALRQGNLVAEAIAQYRLLVKGYGRLRGSDHPDTLTTRHHLALALRDAGRVEEATEALQAVLSDRLRVLGPDHPDTLTTRHHLALALRDAGRVEESAEAYRAVLGDCLRILGPDHAATLAARHNLALTLCGVGRVEESVEAFAALLADHLRILGPDHVGTLAVRNGLAGALLGAGRVEEAVEAFEGVLADRLRVLGPDHAGTLVTRHNHARALRKAGRVEEAVEAFEGVLADFPRVLGPDHPDTLIAHANLAEALEEAGRVEEAVEAYQTVLTDCLRVLGSDHPDTLTTRHSLAGALRAAGQVDEAIGVYRAVLTDCLRVLGPDHPDTLITRDNLVSAFHVAGRFDEAVSVYQSIVEAWLSSSDPDDPDVLDARDDLAWAIGRAKRFDEALADYLKLIADYERVMGLDDPDTLTARNNYICTLKNSGKIVEAVALYRELLSDVERALGADDEFAQEIVQRLSEWESEV